MAIDRSLAQQLLNTPELKDLIKQACPQMKSFHCALGLGKHGPDYAIAVRWQGAPEPNAEDMAALCPELTLEHNGTYHTVVLQHDYVGDCIPHA